MPDFERLEADLMHELHAALGARLRRIEIRFGLPALRPVDQDVTAVLSLAEVSSEAVALVEQALAAFFLRTGYEPSYAIVDENAFEKGPHLTIMPFLRAVRRCPDLYAGETTLPGLHRLMLQVAAATVEPERMNGASQLALTLLSDGRLAIADNGRGLPVTPWGAAETPIAELVFTRISSHAFPVGLPARQFHTLTGHLRGLGGLLNALSASLRVQTTVADRTYAMTCASGVIVERLHPVEVGPLSGTRLIIQPDPEIWDHPAFDSELLAGGLHALVARYPDVTAILTDERTGQVQQFEAAAASARADQTSSQPDVTPQPIFFVLGCLDEYAGGRQIVEGGHVIEHFYPQEGREAEVCARYLALLAQGLGLDATIHREVQDRHTYLTSPALVRAVDAAYGPVDFSPGSTITYPALGRTLRTGWAAADTALFPSSDRQARLSYLAGAYLRYGRANRLVFANAYHKAELAADLLGELGCHDVWVSQVSNPLAAPTVWEVSFVPTAEVARWLAFAQGVRGE